jgi:exonuclease III
MSWRCGEGGCERLGEEREFVGGFVVVWCGWVRVMKLLSWNIRGLGGFEKRIEVRLLVGEKLPCIVCLQETKLSTFDSSLVAALWGSPNVNFSFRPSEGASGGLLTMWDSKEVEVWSSVSRQHFLLIHGKFFLSDVEFYLFNVYALCGPREKEALLASLSEQLLLVRGKQVCLWRF